MTWTNKLDSRLEASIMITYSEVPNKRSKGSFSIDLGYGLVQNMSEAITLN